jgi:hypothetical protein
MRTLIRRFAGPVLPVILAGVGFFSAGVGPPSAITAAAAAGAVFSPPVYVDYKRQGGEPTTVVDRYPFPGSSCPNGSGMDNGSCFRDLAYVSAPQGFAFPHFSYFWKSSDLGQSFRVTAHVPGHGQNVGSGGGGGDSHIAVGQITHNVFFADLPADCEVMNRSTDLGETFVGDNLACALNPGAIDDRPWTDADETVPGTNLACLTALVPTCGNVYVSFINFTNAVAPGLALSKSNHDGLAGTFVTDSVCNLVNVQVTPLSDTTPTPCPDPGDTRLQLAGPVVVDKTLGSPHYHTLYIPFIRGGPPLTGSLSPSPPWDLYVAISTDQGVSWKRYLVSQRAFHNPVNIFVQLTIDKAGNLYYDWAETEADTSSSTKPLGGKTEVKYLVSTATAGGIPSAPPLGGCPAANSMTTTCVSTAWQGPYTISGPGSAVMPWFQAGNAGMVDAVWYQSSSNVNPNTPTPSSNPPVWNVQFAQSFSALGGGGWGKEFLNTHPNHYGQVCTGGLGCATGGNRDLLDFLTVDIDHWGAANTAWADDNNSRNDTRQFFTRQLTGRTVFNRTINLAGSWPVHGNAAIDPANDVYDAAGVFKDSCTGMDLLGMSVGHTGTTVTVKVTVNGSPSAANAAACSDFPGVYTSGIWGAVFWAPVSSTPICNPECFTGDNFYLADRNPPGPPVGEAGRVVDLNEFVTSNELRPETPATASMTCGGPCTITVTADFGTGNPSTGMRPIPSCANLDSVTGASLYYEGNTSHVPLTRIQNGNSEQADVTAALNLQGCVSIGGGGGCSEADGSGSFRGINGGSVSFQSDEDPCEDNDANSEQLSDPSRGESFHSTRIDSVSIDTVNHTFVTYGVGVNQAGAAITFVVVEQAATQLTPATYTIHLSDGYVNSGALITGTIEA